MILPSIATRSGLALAAAVATAALVAVALGAVPAAADWLVTSDGSRIETEGPWEVKGRQVVFTVKNGPLSALRLSDVDLEASEAANAASAPAEDMETEVERRPVLVLTNDDIQRAASRESGSSGDGAPAEGEGEEGEGARAPAPAGPRSEAPVDVVSWRANLSRQVDGLEVIGAVRNNGADVAAKVSVKVTIPDGEGGSIYETNAFLRSTGLAPGATTTFRALLPGIFQLTEDPVFQVTAGGITLLGRTGAPPAAEEGGGGDS